MLSSSSSRRPTLTALRLATMALAMVHYGCSSDEPPGGLSLHPRIHYLARLESVTAPESVAVGDTVRIEAWVMTRGGVERPEQAIAKVLEPGHVRVVVTASKPFPRDFLVDNSIRTTPLVARIPVDVPGTWRFDVIGRPQQIVDVVVTPGQGAP